MKTIERLNEQLGANGAVRFEPGRGGLTRALISTDAATGEIYLHGAHVTQFQPRGQGPVLFVSERSFFDPGRPIRGGVPVIFPWFGPLNHDRSKMHGFVRLGEWDVDDVRRQEDGALAVTLATASSDATKRMWPHDFLLRFTATFGQVLDMSLQVQNRCDHAFTFEEALHTYFAVRDVRRVSVRGLQNERYRDRNISEEWQVDEQNAVRFAQRVDRLYRDSGATGSIYDVAARREIIVAKENSLTTVVWNPWESPAGEFVDLGTSDWEKFVCVETANARENAIALEPGETHVMRSRIEARPLT